MDVRWMLLGSVITLGTVTGVARVSAKTPAGAHHADAGATRTTATTPPGVTRDVEVIVDRGYQPSRITARAGERLRLRFVRRDYSPCSREVVFDSLGIRRELPTGMPVVIDLPVLSAGTIEFHCGMNMIRGVIEVQRG